MTLLVYIGVSGPIELLCVAPQYLHILRVPKARGNK